MPPIPPVGRSPYLGPVAQVRLDVEIPHSPTRVWQALTDQHILERCVMPGGWVVTPGAGFRLHPAHRTGVDGPIDVEVLHVDTEQRLVMQWTGPRLHSQVIWALTPTPGGCRLSVAHTGFFGTPQTRRAQQLRAAYHEGFARRLPTILGEHAGYPPLDGRPRGGERRYALTARVRGLLDPCRWPVTTRCGPSPD